MLRRFSGRYLVLLVPLLVLYANRHVAYWYDLDEFQRWSLHTRKSDPRPAAAPPEFARLYHETDCNYPPLGALIGAGGMAASAAVLDRLDRKDIDPRQVFRGGVAVVEGFAVLLVARLLVQLGVALPSLVALGIYLLPSGWAGGATWGQIDPVTLALLLFGASASARVIEPGPPAGYGRDCIWFAASAGALVAALQVKQTALFALPGGAALLAIGAIALGYRYGRARALLAVSAACSVVLGLWCALEWLLFDPPPGYSSIASYVWTAGIWHTRYLTAHGPSVWTLLPRPGLSSSDLPFFAAVTPKQAGLGAFVLCFLVLSVVLARRLLVATTGQSRFESQRRELISHALCYLGLTYWAMGVWLVGTHERHMAPAFPFLLIGLFGLRIHVHHLPIGAGLALTVAAAIVYGSFVYSVMDAAAFHRVFALKNQAFAATVLLCAFIGLYGGYVAAAAAVRPPGAQSDHRR